MNLTDEEREWFDSDRIAGVATTSVRTRIKRAVMWLRTHRLLSMLATTAIFKTLNLRNA